MARIVIVDDDMAMDMLTDNLRSRGHDAWRLRSAGEAIARLPEISVADLVVLDIIMPWPDGETRTETSGPHTAGMEVFRGLRAQNRVLPILVRSATQDYGLIDRINDDPHASFVSKWDSCPISELVARIHRMLQIPVPKPRLVPFIVHGRDDHTKLEVKNYVQNTLSLPEPIILHEKPNLGRTIIEKFEDYASDSNLVFVLLTPDDTGATAADPNDAKRRARQNVIFEMGYFLGVLGRLSGRVMLLYKGPLELPNDLLGVVYIDISGGVAAAGELIRRELDHVNG